MPHAGEDPGALEVECWPHGALSPGVCTVAWGAWLGG